MPTRSLLAASQWHALFAQTRREWSFVRAERVNAVVTGPRPALDVIARVIAASFCRPIIRCTAPGPLWWADVRGGTLVVDDVARLTRAQQQQILKWSEAKLQIMSLTAEDLFARVERGEFLPELFYRLNVVRIDLHTAGQRAARHTPLAEIA
jgi:hypothetical protein